jgi:hypothetical protein
MPTMPLPREVAKLAGYPGELKGDSKMLTNGSDEVANTDLT